MFNFCQNLSTFKMYRKRTKYGFETCFPLSMALPSTVGQKTKICQTVSFRGDKSEERRSDLMEGANHKRYQYGHKSRNEFSVSKMAAVYHMCC